MRRLFPFFILIFMISCQKKEKDRQENQEQVVETHTDYHKTFEKFIQNDDNLYVVNFWATWCQPCVEELPDFMKLNAEFRTKDHFRMVLVSLDKATDMDTKVKTFISQNQITPDVYLLSDNKRMNEWIPKINASWSGALPATAVYKNGKQLHFTEGKISYEELKKIIQTHL